MSVACCWVVSPPQELEVGARRVPYLLVIEHFISEDSYLFCLIFGGPEKSQFCYVLCVIFVMNTFHAVAVVQHINYKCADIL